MSTDRQDLTSQRDGLATLGVAANRIYVDHGLTGTNRERPGLREALAACRGGDTLVEFQPGRLRSTTPTIRLGDCSLMSWLWLLSSNPISSGCELERR